MAIREQLKTTDNRIKMSKDDIENSKLWFESQIESRQYPISGDTLYGLKLARIGGRRNEEISAKILKKKLGGRGHRRK